MRRVWGLRLSAKPQLFTFGTSPLPVNLGASHSCGVTSSVSAPSSPRSTNLFAPVSSSVLSNPAVTDLLASLPLGDILGGGVPGVPGGTPGGGLPGGLPIGDLPIGDLPVGGLPIGDFPIGDLPVGGLPVGGLPLGGLRNGLPLSDLLSGLPAGNLLANLPLIF